MTVFCHDWHKTCTAIASTRNDTMRANSCSKTPGAFTTDVNCVGASNGKSHDLSRAVAKRLRVRRLASVPR